MTDKNSDINKRIGMKIRLLRVQKGLSQEKLSQLAAVNKNTIGVIERAEVSPTIEMLEKISNALDVELHELTNVNKIDL